MIVLKAAQAAKTEHLIEKVVQLLSLLPEDSPAHRVERLQKGIRIPVAVHDALVHYVVAIPWARGWSVYVTTDSSFTLKAYEWRNAPKHLAMLQKPLYNPRYKVGPQHVDALAIVAAMTKMVECLQRWDRERRNHIMHSSPSKYWYAHETVR